MYLKKIEVHGFKSFANKMVLDFNEGITAIVGPNGSGKSNIADAVRWVLGEQSAKQLRGTKMEDVIFSGTETRRPLGFAYVAITLDNSHHKLHIDYDEVTIARRVYRSGESEYLINGSNCRLKDIHELFVDTGIGKEGYSIIGQGQIDKILSGKPEDRRELFDEAVGIVKYKRRKSVAEKNLEEERLNLSRVTDIIKEIEKQLEPLERQSEIAKKYLKLKEELKSFEIVKFLKEYDKLRSSKTSLEDKLGIASQDLNDVKKELENTKDEYIRLEQELEQYEEVIENSRNKHNDLKLLREKVDGEINILQEQIASILQNDKYFQDRIGAYTKDIESKKEEEKKYLSEKKEYEEKISQVNLIVTQALTNLDKIRKKIKSYNTTIEQENNRIFELLNANSEIKSNIQRYETMLEQSVLRKSELEKKLLSNKSEEDAYKSTIEKHKRELNIISEEIQIQTGKVKSLENEINEAQASISSITEQASKINNQYLSEKSRLESLINLTERYEGYGNSTKKVMELKDKKPGILGVVADIIKTDKKYETAIETVLGGTIQNIVTDTEATAKELITYLKKNRYGRSTFLPLTNISTTKINRNNNVLKEKGVISYADELVEVDNQFIPLIKYLLGRNLIVDNMDNASYIARKYNYTLRIVTLDGELLSPGGSISGGAYRNSSNLLGRRREIERKKERVLDLKKQSYQLANQHNEAKKSREELRLLLEDTKVNLQEKYISQNTAKMQLEQELANIEDMKKDYEEYMKELSEIENQSKALNVNLDELNKTLNNNLEIKENKEESINKTNILLNEAKKEEEEAEEKLSNLKMELNSIQQNMQFVMENLDRIKQETERLHREEASLLSGKHKALEAVDEKKQIISKKEVEIDSLIKSIDKLNNIISIKIAEKENAMQKHKEFFGKREELSSRVNELDKECFRLTSQIETLIEKIDRQMSYMWDEYGLTYTTALDYPIGEDLSGSNLKNNISKIRNEIKNLGSVNVNAIEDFKNLSERYSFLSVQKKDLVHSEENLIKIIEELDTEMRKQFRENFSKIDKQFNKVFKELFGGGMASLDLIDGEDILEAGIRIDAQPPGKRLQNVMQLSGGEKALTAISLLFAIQNLKPSPFCLLDEIEAALDDSNVNRFAEYLIKLSKDTQFILITHRKGTMAVADILYGITMQEKGISTLVSVNLIENELEQ